MGMYTDLELDITTYKDDNSLTLRNIIYEYNNIEFDYDNIEGYREDEKKLFEKYKRVYPNFATDYRVSLVTCNLSYIEYDDKIKFETVECSIKNYTNTYEKFFEECVKPLNIIEGYMKSIYEADDEYKIFLDKGNK